MVDLYHDLHELDVVIQAVSRVRPFTMPREVVLIGNSNFQNFLGLEVKAFKNHKNLFDSLNIPTHGKHFVNAERWNSIQRVKNYPSDANAAQIVNKMSSDDHKSLGRYLAAHGKSQSEFFSEYFKNKVSYFYDFVNSENLTNF